MKTVKITFAAATLFMGLSYVSFAGTPKGEAKDAKTETPAKTETNTGSVKWFHFNGPVGQEGDASRYIESDPECDNEIQNHPLCDLKIMSQGTNPDLPDLTTPEIEHTSKP